MQTNDTTRLLVVHQVKDDAGTGLAADRVAELGNLGFFLDTCQRQLAVLADPDCAPGAALPASTEVLAGTAAYSFLLQTATGLNSPVQGESNILGQFRHGWDRWRQAAPAEQLCRLHHHMHRLLSDARRIRRDYLQGIGGSSYGSLTRKLLQPGNDARVLFVGTGELAHSVAGLFGSYPTAAWSRHADADPLLANQRIFAPARRARSVGSGPMRSRPLSIQQSRRPVRTASQAILAAQLAARACAPGLRTTRT